MQVIARDRVSKKKIANLKAGSISCDLRDIIRDYLATSYKILGKIDN